MVDNYQSELKLSTRYIFVDFQNTGTIIEVLLAISRYVDDILPQTKFDSFVTKIMLKNHL